MSQTARQTGVSVRSLQRGVQSGRLEASRRIGNQLLVDDIALAMWERSRGRGRRWSDSTVQVALDLLDHGETSSTTDALVLSRLQARLQSITIPQLAYLLGGIGGRWNRYRSADPRLNHLLTLIGPSKIDAQQLGIAHTGGWMTFAETDDVSDLEFDLELIEDPSGNVGLVQRTATAGPTRTLLDTFLLGDARESLLARQMLEGKLQR